MTHDKMIDFKKRFNLLIKKDGEDITNECEIDWVSYCGEILYGFEIKFKNKTIGWLPAMSVIMNDNDYTCTLSLKEDTNED